MKNWKLVCGALIGTFAVIALACYGATSAGTKAYDANLMASWLQAIGSIGAIVGSFALVKHQMTLQRRFADDQRADSYRRTVEHAANQVANICNQVGTTPPEGFAETWRYFRIQVEAGIAALSAFQIGELKSTNAIFQHTMLIRFLQDLVNDTQTYVDASPGPNAPLVSDFRFQISNVAATITSIKDLLLAAA
ncbi:hypothetical protein [Paraburkholderia sp. DGU8]|uniref:hypothetical protein n=1 Tax=Paraburkholderia sp. DGU8 TaxID=3161997 RepID=UPI0034678B82